MRRIILNVAITLDGFIEGPNGEIDWCFTDQDYGMDDFLNRIDTIFFGRKSYELMLGMEKNPFPDKIKYVFSRSAKSVGENARIIGDDVDRAVRKILAKPGKDVWLFGGSSLAAFFLNDGWIDEMQLSVHPVLLGGGKPLFELINRRVSLKLTDAKSYPTGLVQLFYRLKPN